MSQNLDSNDDDDAKSKARRQRYWARKRLVSKLKLYGVCFITSVIMALPFIFWIAVVTVAAHFVFKYW